MTTNVESHDLQDAPKDLPLGQLLPGLSALSGDIPPHVVPTSCKSGLLNNAPTWERFAAATIADVLLWPGVGPGRAKHILRFASRSSEFQPTQLPTEVRAGVARSDADSALRLVAAWAVHHGATAGLAEAMHMARQPGTPPSVVAAADLLETIDLSTVALSPDERSFDHRKAAHDLLSCFEGREQAILERVLADGLRPVPTLEEIGKRFGVTRERIRQLEAPVQENLAQRLRLEEYDVLVGHAEVLSTQVGVACPVVHLPAELQPGSSLTDELFAYLAGPFRLSDGWLLRRDLDTSPGALAKSVFDAVADDGIAPADAVFDALSSAGVSPRWHVALLQEADGIALLDGHYVRWGTHVERLTAVLVLAGRPMTNEELVSKVHSVDPTVPARSLTNTLSGEGFRRVGIGRYALATWDGEDYRGIVGEMESALTAGPQPIAELSADLLERFGASQVSVAMYATMHWKFVADGGVVRLRRDDEPYEITTTLEESGRCYLIDGAWAWRVPVDHDLLRGSGRAIPEAFAAHLGATPTHPVGLKAGDQEIKIGWSMSATVGSLRRSAEELELVQGDWMFMRHSSSAGVTFLPLPAWKLQAATPDERVRLFVGASEDDERDLARCLADALGIATTQVGLAECTQVLEERGEDDVLEALAGGGLDSQDAVVDAGPDPEGAPDATQPTDGHSPADSGAPTLWDGTILAVGDWVNSRRGGGRKRGRVVGWPDQGEFPNWVRFEMPWGEQKVAHTRGENNLGGLALCPAPDVAELSPDDIRHLPYEAMRLRGGNPARPGQLVRRRSDGVTGLIVGLIPNSDTARVAVRGSATGEWLQVKVNALELVQDV